MRTKRLAKTSECQTGRGDHQPLPDACPRCQGLLVEERFMDMQQGGFMWGAGWRCVNCGNVVVTVFLEVKACDKASPPPSPGDRPQTNRRPAAA